MRWRRVEDDNVCVDDMKRVCKRRRRGNLLITEIKEGSKKEKG
jgi:hypothetical protein